MAEALRALPRTYPWGHAENASTLSPACQTLSRRLLAVGAMGVECLTRARDYGVCSPTRDTSNRCRTQDAYRRGPQLPPFPGVLWRTSPWLGSRCAHPPSVDPGDASPTPDSRGGGRRSCDLRTQNPSTPTRPCYPPPRGSPGAASP